VVETIAETFVVVNEAPQERAPTVPVVPAAPAVSVPRPAPYQETYLTIDKISVEPVFPEAAIRRRLIYPRLAERARIEGDVDLELFIDRGGMIRRVVVLRESPPGRGFGEAAIKALLGQRCVPAKSNGIAVAVRYRYPVRVRLR
jgi:protein TonB